MNLQAQAALGLVLALSVVLTRPSVDPPTSWQTPASTKNTGANFTRSDSTPSSAKAPTADNDKPTDIDEPAITRLSLYKKQSPCINPNLYPGISRQTAPNSRPNQFKSQCRNLKRHRGFSSGDYGFHLQVSVARNGSSDHAVASAVLGTGLAVVLGGKIYIWADGLPRCLGSSCGAVASLFCGGFCFRGSYYLFLFPLIVIAWCHVCDWDAYSSGVKSWDQSGSRAFAVYTIRDW